MVDDGVHSPTDGADLARFIEMFTANAVTSEARSPLNSALAAGIAADPGLAGLLGHAPPTQQLPVLLFAVVHHLLLESPTEPLAAWYPNLTHVHRSPDDPALMPTFAAFVEAHRQEIVELLATRSTQTNEVGRCALLIPAFTLLAEEIGPLGHLDVGTSAGLTLLSDAYRYRYRADHGAEQAVGPASSVTLTVGTTGAVPVPSELPPIAARCGVDLAPIDVTDRDEARWLEACVWPDQTDRFRRLVAAIELARASPPEILAGDAVDLLADGVERVGEHAHPVVTNSWVLNYFTADARVAYLAELDRLGAERDLSWVYAEAPALIPELPNEPDPENAHLTVLSLARWRNGHRTVEHLATCHPHGYWLHWR